MEKRPINRAITEKTLNYSYYINSILKYNNNMKHIIVILLSLVMIGADGLSEDQALPVDVIEIHATRTREEVIRYLLETKEGRAFDPEAWQRDLGSLRDTGLFYDIQSDVTHRNSAHQLSLDLKNKHSLIPIVKYKYGGDSSLLTLGFYEVNLFHRLLEAGGQFEQMNGKSGFVGWFRHPYFLSPQNRLETEVYQHTIDLPLLTKKGKQQAHIDHREKRWGLRVIRKLSGQCRVGIGFELAENDFYPDNETPVKADRNVSFFQAHDLNNGMTVSFVPLLVLGQIQQHGFYVQGWELGIRGALARRAYGSDFNFVKAVAHSRMAFRLREKINAAVQLKLGTKSGHEFQHKFYLGGLDTVRGFLDGQFRGEHMWLANVEVRPTLWESAYWVLQGNVFMDLSKTWDSTHFTVQGFSHPFMSYGAGVRVILPRIYRAVLRVDVARTETPVRMFGFGVGLQQFF